MNSLANQSFFQLDRSRCAAICRKFFSRNYPRPTHYAYGYFTKYLTLLKYLPRTHMQQKKVKALGLLILVKPNNYRETLVTPYETDRVGKSFVVFYVPIRESVNIKNNLSFSASCFRRPSSVSSPRRKNRI